MSFKRMLTNHPTAWFLPDYRDKSRRGERVAIPRESIGHRGTKQDVGEVVIS